MVGSSAPQARKQTIPRGRYAYHGSYEGYGAALSSFLRECVRRGLKPSGDVFVFDWMTPAGNLSDENCLLEFMVRVGL